MIETFLGEGNLSCDWVNGEHLAGWNPGRLFQEAEAQLGVDRAALVPVQSLDLHKWDPWDTGGVVTKLKSIDQRTNNQNKKRKKQSKDGQLFQTRLVELPRKGHLAHANVCDY